MKVLIVRGFEHDDCRVREDAAIAVDKRAARASDLAPTRLAAQLRHRLHHGEERGSVPGITV